MIQEPKDVRLPLMVVRLEADAMDGWHFHNGVAARAEAMRLLIKLALETARKGTRKTHKL